MSGFTFSSSEITVLQSDFNNLQSNPDATGAAAQIYVDILNDISQQGITGSTDGVPIYGDVPVTTVDPAVWDWFSGAISVNKNTGFTGQFVVDYTVDQYNIRQSGNSFSSSQFAVASNGLAANILQNNNEDGILQKGTLPTLSQIGGEDAGKAAVDIFQPIYGGNDASGWAGTLLFPFLGDATYFNTLLLSSNVISNSPTGLDKQNPGMYDLVAALNAQQEASSQAGLSNIFSALVSYFDPIYANVPNYQTTLTDAISTTNESFASYYNFSTNNVFNPGNDLAFNPIQSLVTRTQFIAGYATNSENIPTSTIDTPAVIVGGSGINTIVAPAADYNFLIDSGTGTNSTTGDSLNTLDLSQISGSLSIQGYYNPNGPQQLIIEETASTIYGYDFNEFVLNSSPAIVNLSNFDQNITIAPGANLDTIMGNPRYNDAIDLSGTAYGSTKLITDSVGLSFGTNTSDSFSNVPTTSGFMLTNVNGLDVNLTLSNIETIIGGGNLTDFTLSDGTQGPPDSNYPWQVSYEISGGGQSASIDSAVWSNPSLSINGTTTVIASDAQGTSETFVLIGFTEIQIGAPGSGVRSLYKGPGSGDPLAGPIPSGNSNTNIGNGNTQSGTNITSGNSDTIMSGGTASNFSVNTGGGVIVASGGTTSGTYLSGGAEVVSSGGTATATTISTAGGTFLIGAGGTAFGIVMSGGTLGVYGGTVTSAVVMNSATEILALGGVAYDSVVMSSGTQIITDSGIANETTLYGSSFVYGGATNSTIVNNGGNEVIDAGGCVTNTMINGGGTEVVNNNGLATGTTIGTGASLLIEPNGTATGNIILSGGYLVAFSGSTVTDSTVSSGGYLIAFPGSEVTSTTGNVLSAGIVDISGPINSVSYFDSSVQNNTINSSGSEYVLPMGEAVSTTINNGGTQYVLSAGSVVSATLYGNANQIVSSGGVTSSTFADDGTTQSIYGISFATSDGAYGGNDIVYYGGVASGTVVESGGYEIVSAGGTANDTIINSDGSQYLDSGGIASGTVVESWAHEYVSGTARNITVSNGGTDVVYSGGVAFGTVLNSGGTEVVSSVGVANGTYISNGGIQDVYTGGWTNGTTINNGGIEVISSGGTASGSLVNSGGLLKVSSGGITDAAYVGTGGNQLIYAGGVANNTTDIGGQVIISGGTAFGLTVSDGTANGVLVYSGGVVSGGTVYIGTNENIFSGARAVGVTVDNAGLEVTLGGVASGSILNPGAHLDVSGGLAIGTTINNGGIQIISAGGIGSGTIIDSGGQEIVSSGGTAIGANINSGGTEVIYSGGTANDVVISSGGTEILWIGATVTGSIDFSGADATLSISGASLPTNVISGFDAGGITSENIVLNGFSYSSADTATLGAGNFLTLDLSGTISTLQFDPSQSFAGDYFAVEENSQGQVVIVDPIIGSSPPAMTFLSPTVSSSGLMNAWNINSPQDLFAHTLGFDSFTASFLINSAGLLGQTALNAYSSSQGQSGWPYPDQLKASLQHGIQLSTLFHSG